MIAVPLALLAAVLNAGSDLLQRRAGRDVRDRLSPWRLMRNLARRPGWWGGLLAGVGGLGAHVLALSVGEIATVQPLMVLELPVAVLGAALWGTRPTRREVTAVGLLTVGLAGFVVLLSPTGGAPLVVPATTWAIGLPVLLGLVAGLALLGFRYEKNVRAGLLGVAAGIGYGTTAILFAVAGPTTALDGVGALVGCWQSYAAAVVGIASFSLLQQALHAGLLVVTAPGLTLANPLVAVVWGVLVFGEQTRTGPWLVAALGAAALLVLGTVQLARSPLVQHRERPARRTTHGSGPTGSPARVVPSATSSRRFMTGTHSVSR